MQAGAVITVVYDSVALISAITEIPLSAPAAAGYRVAVTVTL